MSSSQLLLPVFSSLIGMTVSVLLLTLLCLQEQKDTGIRVGMLFSGAVFVFFAALCATATLTFGQVSRTSGLWIGSANTLVISSAVLPSLILWSWHASSVLMWRSRQSRILLGLSWLWTGVVLVVAWSRPGPSEVSYLNQLVGFSSIASLTPAYIGILRLPLDRRLHMYLRATCLLYVATGVLSVFVPPWNQVPSVWGLLLAHLRLIFLLVALLGSFVLSARFRRADLFVRWGTWVTSIGVISMTGTLFFFSVIEPPLNHHSPLSLLAFASLTGALVLVGISVISRSGSRLENYVLGRKNLHKGLVELRSLLFSSSGREFLFAETESALSNALRAEAVRLVTADVVSTKPNPVRAGIVQ